MAGGTLSRPTTTRPSHNQPILWSEDRLSGVSAANPKDTKRSGVPLTSGAETTRSNPGKAEHPDQAGKRDHHSGTTRKESDMADLPELLTRREVAEVLRVSQACPSRWARPGTGPRCLWLSPTVPRYQREDVLAFLSRAAA